MCSRAHGPRCASVLFECELRVSALMLYSIYTTQRNETESGLILLMAILFISSLCDPIIPHFSLVFLIDCKWETQRSAAAMCDALQCNAIPKWYDIHSLSLLHSWQLNASDMINSRHTNMEKKNSNKETLAQIVNRIEYFNGIHLEVSKINLYEELEFKSRPVCDRLIFFHHHLRRRCNLLSLRWHEKVHKCALQRSMMAI